ncbi:peptide chain release factor N(5)-glutamine methyltransferase [Pedobacter frigidisoli]|uniref:peptide chain release factor N(5)-glutamine methyltransferase n=1 Tax=Pedobacter frigidisoli TaxID=2530455 RepID=A0A4R0NN92_9SPHI|nr:peptide chain release factor N(5)-glutamine methyltransferase [Pedobacter frigidisoli]TCD00615.1 peptide chain release factor N(5)-glutamine methyltransferase [Pedobacter frigidisoli]
MKIGELEEHYVLELEQLYDEYEAKALFSLAAENVLEFSPTKLRLMKESSTDFIHFQKLLTILNDLKIGKPIQHILGEAHFYGSIFKVDENVLIPRPETEELVDWIISVVNSKSPASHLNILDIGTGSGCIPITLKKYLLNAEVSTLDVSLAAINVAKENADSIGVTINFINADILNFATEAKFDIIVSNPPYIRDLEKAQMHNNVLVHEPHLALFVSDENPLIFYKAIADFAKTNLKPDGELYFEINEYLATETIEMLQQKGFVEIELKQDMQGKDRMIKTRLL